MESEQGGTATDAVVQWAHSTPHAPALMYGGPRGLVIMSYAELGERLIEADDLLARTIGEQVPVGVVMRPDVSAIALLLAALRRRQPAVLFPAAATGEDLSRLLTLAPVALPLEAALGSEHPRRVERDALRAGDIPDTAIAQLTSGTLQSPRLACRSPRALRSEIGALVPALELAAGTTVLCGSSLAHSYGLMGGLLAPLSAGSTVLLPSGISLLSPTMHAAQPEVVFGLWPSYMEMLNRTQRRPVGGRVRLAFSAGAPLPGGLYDRFLDRFGIPLRQDYGSTETGTIALDLGTTAAPPSAGAVLEHMEWRLVPVGDEPLDPGERGALQVRSRACAHGYLTADGFAPIAVENGWFPVGDVAGLDRAGRLVVTRRRRVGIRTDEGLVFPHSVERVIEAMPGVRESVVLAHSGGLRAVVAGYRLDGEQVAQWCRARLPRAHVPSVHIIDALPRSPAGKVLAKYL